MRKTDKLSQRKARARRTGAKAKRSGLPRLLVFKSLNATYAQVIDDDKNKVLCGASNLKGKKKGVEGAIETGKEIAKLALAKKVKEVSFDRNGYLYHGKVKALADAAREAGLKF